MEEVSDERLEEIYDLLHEPAGSGRYSKDELAEIYRRVDMHKKGLNPTFSVEEAHNYIRQQAKRK